MAVIGPLLLAAVIGSSSPAARDVRPDWLVKPTAEQIWWAYPLTALRMDMSGSARIHCRVQLNGLAANCEVLSEDPPGWGSERRL